ncbi:MAG: hypothetical protein M3072_16260, partial [Candidatus Dormibacteraeota bacterium]|nr:hypothetical protein [Candidatus Dormibacteraeota bacterium]
MASAAMLVLARPLDAAAATVGITYVANTDGDSVTEYVAGMTGDATPIRTISGVGTGLSDPAGVALGVDGTLYVANSNLGVTEYAPGATGNATPIRAISGPSTGLSNPDGVVLDASGTLYVA